MSSLAQAKIAEVPKQDYTGADALVAFLKNQGVATIFGLIGGAIMPVYDALYRAGGPRHIIAGHEQGAAHMAEGFARATGKVGVVLATSGPGATNLVTGLADAYMDSTPLVAVTGQVASSLLGNDAFQEADMRGIAMPISKHSYQVRDPSELPAILAEAFAVAVTGRPGPVVVDLPRDVALAKCRRDAPSPCWPAAGRPPRDGDPLMIERALGILLRARRPVILAGGGVIHAGAHRELTELAELLDIPVTTTLMGLGGFPADHRLFLGMPGMHGTGFANLALHNADAILVVGARLDDRVTGRLKSFAPGARLIHIDVDESEIGKNLEAAAPLVGDAGPVLRALIKGVKSRPERPDLAGWRRRIDHWRRRFPMTYRSREGVIMPQRVVEELGRRLGREAIVVTGVGQHQMFTAQYFPFKRPRSLITSGGLGTMGFGLPAAIGAKLGRPRDQVVLIDGDGSFLMTIQELATAVRYRVPLVCAVMNNGRLGMVAQWQEMFLDGRLSQSDLVPPPYDRLARAFGALGRRVERPEELGPALDWALAESGRRRLPAVLDIMVDPGAQVLPMVPPGEANADFIPCEEAEV